MRAEYDFWLRADGHRRNPGTTADVIAAALFVLLREKRLTLASKILRTNSSLAPGSFKPGETSADLHLRLAHDRNLPRSHPKRAARLQRRPLHHLRRRRLRADPRAQLPRLLRGRGPARRRIATSSTSSPSATRCRRSSTASTTACSCRCGIRRSKSSSSPAARMAKSSPPTASGGGSSRGKTACCSTWRTPRPNCSPATSPSDAGLARPGRAGGARLGRTRRRRMRRPMGRLPLAAVASLQPLALPGGRFPSSRRAQRSATPRRSRGLQCASKPLTIIRLASRRPLRSPPSSRPSPRDDGTNTATCAHRGELPARFRCSRSESSLHG